MGLILEVILVIVAWKRGWKAMALLPLGIGLGIALIGGVIIGASGNDDFPIAAFAIVDIVVIIVLIVMIAKPRQTQVSNVPYNSDGQHTCPQCGTSVSTNWKNCPQCGQPI